MGGGGGGGGEGGGKKGGAIGKEQDEGNNTIKTRCCVGVGRAIYTEVVNQQDTTRQIILNTSTVPCPHHSTATLPTPISVSIALLMSPTDSNSVFISFYP